MWLIPWLLIQVGRDTPVCVGQDSASKLTSLRSPQDLNGYSYFYARLCWTRSGFRAHGFENRQRLNERYCSASLRPFQLGLALSVSPSAFAQDHVKPVSPVEEENAAHPLASGVPLGSEHVLFDFGLLVALIVASGCPTDLFASERSSLCISELEARVVLRGTSLLEADQPKQQEEFETGENLLLETITTVFVNPVVVQLSWFANSASRFRSVHVEASPGYVRSGRPGLHERSHCLWSDSGAVHVSVEIPESLRE